MEFKLNNWLGNWTNFEKYIYSTDPAMERCWAEAEQLAANIPMLKNGAKAFWQMACETKNAENPVRLGGWIITGAENGMNIHWLTEDGTSLGRYDYTLSEIVPKGLEGKPNFLFVAEKAPENWPFRYMLAMEPMPDRQAKNNGGLLSHLHYQYGSSKDVLLTDGKLANPMWYATMCDGDSTLLDQCNIVRALHRLPRWDNIPE